MALRSILAASAAATAAGSMAAKLLVSQSETYSIYSSAGTTVTGGKPFFAFADGLNAPVFAELYDSTGKLVWTFSNNSGTSSPTYLVDTARHCEGADNGAVDIFVAEADANGVTVYGLSSASTTPTPAWSVPLAGCSIDGGGGTYQGLQASANGNRVAVQCIHKGTPAPTARVYLIGGQSGKITWSYDLGASVKAGQGQVQITQDGSFVLFVNEGGTPTPNTATAYIFDGGKGTLRDSITIPFFITAAISDTGNYVVVGDEPDVHVWMWDAGSAKYAKAYDLAPPPAAVGVIPWDVQMSTGADSEELVIVGYISGDVKTVQVSAWALTNATLVTNWISKTNTQLQENPTLRADGEYIGVSLWGDSGEKGYPTVVLLKRGSDVPLFSYVTPGSMFAVDVQFVTAAGKDTVYLAAAGKHVPANAFGNGGDAFAWEITF